MAAGALIAAGFADFSLIAFHFQKTATVAQGLTPVFYAMAMAGRCGGLSGPWKTAGQIGPSGSSYSVRCARVLCSTGFSPCTGLGTGWDGSLGIGMGAQDSCLKAVLSAVFPAEKRSTAFGIFDTVFGLAWFAGSAGMGLLYGRSIPGLVIFSVATQILALPLLALPRSKLRPRPRNQNFSTGSLEQLDRISRWVIQEDF